MPDDMDVAANVPDASHDDPNSPDVQDNFASPPWAVEANASTASTPDAAAEPSTEPAAPGVDARAAQRRVQEFREFLRSCTAPLRLAKPWSFLGEDDEWLRIDMSPVEFLDVMKE
jgi:hypothetical protein